MFASICIFLPPVLMLYLWLRNKEKAYTPIQVLAYYCMSALLVNFLTTAISTLFSEGNMGIGDKLQTYTGFALKYMLLGCAIAVVLPLAVGFWRKKVDFSCTLKMPGRFTHWRLVAIIYAAVLLLLNISLCFDVSFRGDECFTIWICEMSVPDMIRTTATDVHPPLYYLIVMGMCAIFGNTPFVYHIASLIPYLIIAVLSLTLVWKVFGKEPAFLMITLFGLMSEAIYFNRELRMYSWAALFLVLAFFALYEILRNKKTVSFVLFTGFSLGAAYSHYYSLLAVAFFYVALIVVALIRRKGYILKTVLTCVVTVLAYSPWLVTLLTSFKKSAENFWITYIPSFRESCLYLFNSSSKMVSLLLFMTTVCVAFIAIGYDTGLVRVEKANKKWTVAVNTPKGLANFSVWMIAGGLCVFGTIVVGIGVSKLFRPLLLLRYLFPVAAVAWVILSVGVSKCKAKHIITPVLVVALLAWCIPQFMTAYQEQKNENALITKTLGASVSQIQEDDVILTDHAHLEWTVLGYYYPQVPVTLVNADEPLPLEESKENWLIFSGEVDEEQLVEQGYICETVVSAGRLGTIPVSIVKAVKTAGD